MAQLRQDPDPRAWDETKHKLGDSNIRPFGLDIHNPVFLISSIVIAAFVLIALANQTATAEFFGWLRPWLTSTFDWFLVLSVNAITLFCLLLIFHPVGKVRIGGKDAKPEYSYAGWIAMMFAAGIGIGLLFFGVLEPVYYNFSENGAARPLGIDIADNAYIGVVGAIHHWGLEGWAVYAVVSLSLGIFSYNYGFPLTLRVGGTDPCLRLMDVNIWRGRDRYAERRRCRGRGGYSDRLLQAGRGAVWHAQRTAFLQRCRPDIAGLDRHFLCHVI
jgi:BCCT family betaine/carnitine transporter